MRIAEACAHEHTFETMTLRPILNHVLKRKPLCQASGIVVRSLAAPQLAQEGWKRLNSIFRAPCVFHGSLCTQTAAPVVHHQSRAISSSSFMQASKVKELRVNDEIPGNLIVRLVHEDGSSALMKASEALELAEGKDEDLVEISDKSNPPVCKILNYSKYLAQQRRQMKLNQQKERAAARAREPKEMRLGPATDQHDFDIKMGRVFGFLDEGRRVRVFVQFKRGQGRLQDSAINILQKAAAVLGQRGEIERMTSLEDIRKKEEEDERVGRTHKSPPLELWVRPKSTPKPQTEN